MLKMSLVLLGLATVLILRANLVVSSITEQFLSVHQHMLHFLILTENKNGKRLRFLKAAMC